MGLLSFLKRSTAADAHAAPPADVTSPESIRARARRRFIGAAILVVAAVVVLPLVFDSKPRPLPVDIAIEIPKRDAVTPPAVPAPRASAPAMIDEEPAAAAPPSASQAVTAASGPASAATAAAAPPRPAMPKAAAPVAAHAATGASAAAKPTPKPAAEPVKPTPKAEPRAQADRRALALLEGQDAKPAAPKPAADASVTRFVVQVGAFEQASAAKDARQRVEKLGLHTFVQEITTPQGKRIRVRLGPYASRDEAEKAQAKLSAGGVQASVVPQ